MEKKNAERKLRDLIIWSTLLIGLCGMAYLLFTAGLQVMENVWVFAGIAFWCLIGFPDSFLTNLMVEAVGKRTDLDRLDESLHHHAEEHFRFCLALWLAAAAVLFAAGYYRATAAAAVMVILLIPYTVLIFLYGPKSHRQSAEEECGLSEQ